MSGAGLVLCSLVTLAAPALPPRFESVARAIRLDVVVAKDGKAVRGLTADDFEVRDDGVPQKVEMASRSETAVHAVLALDLSSSLTRHERVYLKQAAAAFLGMLESSDRATLVTFTDAVRLILGPDVPASVGAALPDLAESGSTALFDAVYAAMAIADTAPGRPVVIVFTDGRNESSWLTWGSMLEAAGQFDATVHVVSTIPWTQSSVSKKQRLDSANALPGVSSPMAFYSSSILRQVVDDTGGEVWSDTGRGGLEKSFKRVLSEIKNRYLLRCDVEGVPRPGWHQLEVRLKKRKGDVRVRRGYFAMPDR